MQLLQLLLYFGYVEENNPITQPEMLELFCRTELMALMQGDFNFTDWKKTLARKFEKKQLDMDYN